MTADDRRFETAAAEDSRTSPEDRTPTETGRDPDLVGAEAAMRRAARVARRRAAETSKRTTTGQPMEHSDKPQDIGNVQDLRSLTFSQAHGYEEVPGPLKLEELPRAARTHIWNVFYVHLDEARFDPTPNVVVLGASKSWAIGGAWEEVFRAKHLWHDDLPLDEWRPDFGGFCRDLRNDIETMPFYKVFDLLQFVMRHPQCPRDFSSTMKRVFGRCKLAYTIDEGERPTILPAVTVEEGNSVVESLNTLRAVGLRASAEHLRRASECINENDWSGSIRESIHAVESVARQIAPDKTDTLTQALNSIDKHSPLHSQLKKGIQALYWYTSDEQGVRHALLDSDKARVGMDEAVFMLGACASFASYLWRKHNAGEVS